MNKLFILILSGLWASQASASDQTLVENFFQDHTASSYSVYCRTDIQVPECRSLIKYSNNETGEEVEAFQISFSAPARPFAAVELFLPSVRVDENGDGAYYNFVDKTTAGSFQVEASGEHQVVKTKHSLRIKDLPFGELHFNRKAATIILKDGNKVVYKRMK